MANETFSFIRLDSRLDHYGFTRYAVYEGLDRLGEVFQFLRYEGSRTLRWMAQTQRGVLVGWNFRTRKEAAVALHVEAANGQ